MTTIASIFRIQQDGDKQISTSTSGEKPTEPSTDTSAEPATQAEVEPKQENKAAENNPDLMVKVEGPVGRVFTEALNKVLATESVELTLVHHAEQEEKPPLPEAIPTEVHTFDGENVEMSDVVKMSETVMKSEGTEYVIAIENAKNSSRALVMLSELEQFKNVKVCLSMESAAYHIARRLKS